MVMGNRDSLKKSFFGIGEFQAGLLGCGEKKRQYHRRPNLQKKPGTGRIAYLQ